MKVLLFLVLNFSLILPLSSQDISQAFDFWVGDWEVSSIGSNSEIVRGTSNVSRILDDRVIEEVVYDPSRNFKGRSLSVYNSQNATWHQAWVDNQGGYYDYLGFVDDEDRIFQTIQADANDMIYRMRFLDLREDALTWKWEAKKIDEDA